jgi:hypothetical protein
MKGLKMMIDDLGMAQVFLSEEQFGFLSSCFHKAPDVWRQTKTGKDVKAVLDQLDRGSSSGGRTSKMDKPSEGLKKMLEEFDDLPSISGRKMHYILEEDGTARECKSSEWSLFRMQYGTCHVGLTHFIETGCVSTIFLGLNSALPFEEPEIFETFVGEGQGSGGDVIERYSTYLQAKEGHAKWVAAMAEKLGQSIPDDETIGQKLLQPIRAELPEAT